MSWESKVGDYVWVQPKTEGDSSLPWAAKIITIKDKKTEVVNDNGEKSLIDSSWITGPLHGDVLKSVEDMISLNDLQEKTLLRNIYLRYLKDNIYTYIGWILVAVNPYRQLPIYTEREVELYRNSRMGDLPPHIYALGARSYYNIKTYSEGQCIIISGESGAGKTESTKLLINFLAALSEKSSVSQQIIDANPILEAFGNAKTTKNDNSSRFGKYIEIYFGDSGAMEGASINHYLLEKSRIKSQNMGERNYHIFYSMLAGLSPKEKKELRLGQTSHYAYLKNGNIVTCEGRNEAQEFENVKNGMATLKFTKDETWNIFKLLSAILHLGNLTYNSITIENMEASEIAECEHLDVLLGLLRVQKKEFVEALTQKTMFIGGNKVVTPVSKEQACVNRDGFSMALYSHLFSYIMKQINKTISDRITHIKKQSIGILDIFGFENFAVNSFEQLCINFANEHLQQFFVEHIFKQEQEEYKKEGIEWQECSYNDNEPVLQLIGGGTMNILKLIDEQTIFPKGDDSGFFVNAMNKFGKHQSVVCSKSEVNLEFGIKHYAGNVTYKVQGFVEKNRNSVSADWVNLIGSCGNSFLRGLFIKELSMAGKANKTSLVMQYKHSLEMLMAALSSSSPFFVRCIKPNNMKKPSMFNHALCSQQLQYLGIMDTAKVRRAGYPMRFSYFEFIQRYAILVPGSPVAHKVKDSKALAKAICEKVLGGENYQLGTTKVFLKSNLSNVLESERDKLFEKSATIIQKTYRAYRCRKRYVALRKAVKAIQKGWRAFKPRRDFITIRRGYLRLQAAIKSRQLTYEFSKLRRTIILFEARCKGYLARKYKKSNKTQPTSIDDIIDLAFFDLMPKQSNKQVLADATGAGSRKPSAPEDFEAMMTFAQFASENFMGNVGYKYSPSKDLGHSLLDLPTKACQLAAPALWAVIQRFMGDSPEPKVSKKSDAKNALGLLYETISKNSSNAAKIRENMKLLEEKEAEMKIKMAAEGPANLRNWTIAHRNKLITEIQRLELEGESMQKSYTQLRKDPMASEKDKLHFIIGHGILVPELRDEIYCQICKQLTENPHHQSNVNGWCLLYLCCSCFVPSPSFTPVLTNFILSNGNKLDSYSRLQRTLANGTRLQPPTQFEINALKKQKPTIIDVYLPDGIEKMSMVVDAATTADEVCSLIFNQIKLKSTFGFSLFISMFSKTLSLDSGGKSHVMDAIGQCEQYAKEKELSEGGAPWKFHLRKEMFAPWPEFTAQNPDQQATNLIYLQIKAGLQSGQYKCTQESELAMLMAQFYYVQYGRKVLPEILTDIIREIIPEPLIKQKGLAHWGQFIVNYFQESYFVKCKFSYERVKTDIIEFAKTKWPIYFSKYYPVKQSSGINLDEKDLILAVNSEGIYFANNNTEVILKWPYVEIALIEHRLNSSGKKSQLEITTVGGYKFSFETPLAENISNSVKSIIEELKKHSKYVVALSDYTAPDDSFLALKKGDLICLYGEYDGHSQWIKGYKPKTGDIGEFPAKFVYVLPTVTQPPRYILDNYVQSQSSFKKKTIRKSFLDLKRHTLENYAQKYFGQNESVESVRMKWKWLENQGSKKPSSSTPDPGLWKYSKSSLSGPLHRSLQGNSQHKENALKMYAAILDFTGDKRISVQQFLTRPIFQPPLDHEVLRDELYCQLMKLVTDNPKPESEKRGWQLLSLAAGLYPCSPQLIEDLRLFLETRPKVVCQEALYRLEKTIEQGPRKHLHHWIEVEAVLKSIPMMHLVTFPNGMEKSFEVESSMKVSDLVDKIIGWLGIKQTVGFTLVVEFDGKSASLNSNDFLFDAIQMSCQLCSSEHHNKTAKETQKLNYVLKFVKKLWINTIPGQDPIADTVCYYHQELNKYLMGCHTCSIEDINNLAAYILLAMPDIEEIQNNVEKGIKNRLPSLVPSTVLQQENSKFDWVTPIKRNFAYNISRMTSEQAQTAFLKCVEGWPTFGTTFFEVDDIPLAPNQSAAQLILGVNKEGILAIDYHTNNIRFSVPYKEMKSCSYNDKHFSVELDTAKYRWLTKVGFKIADLVNSYMKISNEFMTYYR